MSLTIAELGVVFLVLFGLFHWLGIFAKLRAVLALLGVVAVGLGGFLGHLLLNVGRWAEQAVGTVTAWAFGTALAAALFIALAVILIHDLHPSKGATRRTGWIAIAVGTLLVAGVAGIPALAPAAGALRSLLSTITGFINTL